MLAKLACFFAVLAVARSVCNTKTYAVYGQHGGDPGTTSGINDMILGTTTGFRRNGFWHDDASTATTSYDNVRFGSNGADLYAVTLGTRAAFTDGLECQLLSASGSSLSSEGTLEMDSSDSLLSLSYFADLLFVNSTDFYVTNSPMLQKASVYHYSLNDKTGTQYNYISHSNRPSLMNPGQATFFGYQGPMFLDGSDIIVVSSQFDQPAASIDAYIAYGKLSADGSTLSYETSGDYIGLDADCERPIITDVTNNPITGNLDANIMCYKDISGTVTHIGTHIGRLTVDWDVEIVKSDISVDHTTFAFHEECSVDPAWDI